MGWLSNLIGARRARIGVANRIRLLFAAVILGYLMQYWVVRKIGEPYPALTMPSFNGVGTNASGDIIVRGVGCEVLFADGGPASLAIEDLLAEAAGSHVPIIASHMFGLPPRGPTAPRLPEQSLATQLFPALAFNRARAAQTAFETDPETERWLVQRLQKKFPGRHISSIRFIWYNDAYHPEGWTRPPVHRVLGIREVSLE